MEHITRKDQTNNVYCAHDLVQDVDWHKCKDGYAEPTNAILRRFSELLMNLTHRKEFFKELQNIGNDPIQLL